MALFVDNNTAGSISMFYKSYEPKTKNRFVFEIQGIPAFMVKKSG